MTDHQDGQQDSSPDPVDPATAADDVATRAATGSSEPSPHPEPGPLDVAATGEDPASDEGSDVVAEEQPDPETRAAADGRTPGELLVALEQAQADRDEYVDALQRERAEFENFRRRSTREAAGARAAGVGDLAGRLLDVLDDLDRTVAGAEESSDPGLAGGVTAVRRKLTDVLLAAGVQRIDEVGVPFDATRHEAVQQVPAEEPVDEPEVAEVLRPGYVHNDRCLRAAMVAVRQ